MNAIIIGCAVAVAAAALAMAGGDAGLCTSDVRTIATGFQFTEGPVWHPDGYIIFSDIPADTIYELKDEAGGKAEVFRRPSGNSNGLTFDRANRLIACEHGNRRVSITDPDGTVHDLATRYDGKRLNSPNDVAVKSDGAVYFTDPPYGVRPENREMNFQGVYRIAPDGALTLLVDDFVKPNGICFSPDEAVLYIADTDMQWVRAFDVREDGLIENDRVFAMLAEGAQLRPDGMKVDTEGNLYVAGAGGVEVFGPDGKHLETIAVPEGPANLAFGGADGRTLYITARTSLYAVAVRYAGVDVPPRPE